MRALLIPTLAALLAGCAAQTVPTGQLASTEAAIRLADEGGANEAPRAALHMRLAREQLALGHGYIANGMNLSALYAFQRAQYDAGVALSLAREEATRLEALEAQKKVQALRAEAGVQP
jgi:hypothetical protein